MKNAFPSLVPVSPIQALNTGSDICVSDDVERAGKVYVDTEDGKRPRLHCEQWEVPTGVPDMQDLPQHLWYILSPYHNDYSVYNRSGQWGADQW